MTDLEEDLETWGRVVRVHAAGPARVGSLEGRWRSPQCWDEVPVPRGTPLSRADIAHAWTVEVAWTTLGTEHRYVLRARYCGPLRIAPQRVLRRLGLVDAKLAMAQAAIAAALERPVSQNRNIRDKWARETLALVLGSVYTASAAPTAGARLASQ